MKKLLPKILVCALVFQGGAFTALHGQEERGTTIASGETPETVYVLPLHGPIDKSLMITFRRAFREIEEVRPAAVIIDVDTPGGGLLQTEELITWMRSSDIPFYSYVNTHAQSAGAIICFGTRQIFMAPGSRIGSAMPIMISGGQIQELSEDVQEKFLSDTRALVRGLAQENGHLEDVALCMVDPDRELKIGDRVVCKKGEILNLTAEEAVEVIPPRTQPLLARSIQPDLESVLGELGLAGARVVRFKPEPAEYLAQWIVRIGPILFMIGILGIFTELKTPGLGIPGMIGGICLGVYFLGHHVAGLAGVEDLALVAVGLALIVLELFVIPGFGVAGILGIACITAGTLLGMIPYIPDLPPELPEWNAPGIFDYIEDALVRFLIMVCGAVVGGFVLARVLPKTATYGRLVLDTSLTNEDGYTSSDARYAEFIGKEGVAQTALRPSGIVQLGEERLDVVTRGDLVQKGARVRVAEVHGPRIIVEPVE